MAIQSNILVKAHMTFFLPEKQFKRLSMTVLPYHAKEQTLQSEDCSRKEK